MHGDSSAPLPLPIDDVLGPLRAALVDHVNVVLQAPPGAGKTTRVPLSLMGEPWLEGRRIVMLEPRRLAARAAARRMANSLGETVGRTVGVRMRGETRAGRRTRVEVVTEGVLTRMLLHDPALEQIGLLIFDEFHERSLHADVGLALALETQALLRPDLRLLVMSATLDVKALGSLLGDAPVLTSHGRAFPVVTHYRPRPVEQTVEHAVAAAVRHALASDAGSVLAFLPGAAEIRRTADILEERPLPARVRVLPLFGALPARQQDDAIAPAVAGSRKVVLATSIAETSRTIEGVRVVVDGGLSRVPTFSPRSGMSRLRTVRVSRAAADQRRGRGGRTEPGVCYRLWASQEELGFLAYDQPEILDADLAPLALDLAVAGVVDPASLRWLDVPPAPALAQARELLQQLGAITSGFRITPHGRAMSRLGTHPRLAHTLLRGRELGIGPTACVVAALLDDSDVLRHERTPSSTDLRERVARVISSDGPRPEERHRERRVAERIRLWRSALELQQSEGADENDCGVAVALAYPDRIARRRRGTGARYLLRNGLGAALPRGSPLTDSPFLAVAELDGRRPEAGIVLAAPLARADVDRLFSEQITTEDIIGWREPTGASAAVRRERLGAIVLRESPLPNASGEAVAESLLAVLTDAGRLALHWQPEATRVRERLAFLHRHLVGWLDVSDSALASTAREWLLPHLVGLRRRDEVDALDLGAILLQRLSWAQRAELDQLAPTHLEVPSGSRIRVDYSDPGAPVLAVRLQEVFGLTRTPTLARGAVPVLMQLLSPASRPVQITRDLEGFWRSSYQEVRRELRGRYPKHAWPEDPVRAAPTRHTRRRGS